jgi:hypothetical protein
VVWPADLVDASGAVLHEAGESNPSSDVFKIGSSLGGILSSIAPAFMPEVVAAAPISGGSGLSDIGLRSELGPLIRAVFLELMGPVIPFIDPRGQHAVHPPSPSDGFDNNAFMLNMMGRYFETRGKEIHFQPCQAKLAECSWIPQPPQ